MAESYRLGLSGKLYRNGGAYNSPAWNEVTNVKDLTLSGETDTADISTRGTGGFKAKVPTLLDASLEFQMVWNPADPNFAALLTAWLNKTSVDMVALDGPITTPGNQGPRANWVVTKFSRKEPLTDAMTVDVGLSPTYSANPPTWFTS